jgi:hypothetical protein
MKKILCTLLIFTMIFALAGCGAESKKNSDTADTTADHAKIDVDLTKLSSTMVYSEVYNMVATPKDYIGKTVKMNGSFSVFQDETTKQYYFACLIADAAECCSQGLEFVLTGNPTYPDDYPQQGSDITVTGTFDTYEENGNLYCRLINAELVG